MRPSISTAAGDTGKTGLFGGRRIAKNSPRIHAYGDVDELSSILGVALSFEELPPHVSERISAIQQVLFVLGSDLATPIDSSVSVERITDEHIHMLEEWGSALEQHLPSLRQFILPGGISSAATLHHARTICRRVERWIVELSQAEDMNDHILIYLNRLSDYLFLAAREANRAKNVSEIERRS